MSLRIAQVAPLIYRTPPVGAGGTERVVSDLTEALCRAGHSVTLFAAEGSKTSAQLVTSGPPVADVANAPPGYAAAREAILLDQVRAASDRFDIIHFHTEFAHAAVFTECRSRTLTTVHWRVDQADRQAFFSHFTDLLVASISAAHAVDLPPSALHVGTVHHGIPLDRFSFETDAEARLAFIGRMTDQKGRVLRALP